MEHTNLIDYSRENIIEDLNSIRSNQDEIDVFNKIANNSRVIITMYTQNGTQYIDGDQEITSIKFHQFGEPLIVYELLDEKNLDHLMTE